MTTGWDNTSRPGRRRFPPKVIRAILRKHPTCQLNLPGCTEVSTEADHVVGWQDATAMGWTIEDIEAETNGQGTCATCHGRKSQAEAQRGRKRNRRQPRRPTRPHPGLRSSRPPLTPPPPPPHP